MFQLHKKHNLTHNWIKYLLANTTNYVFTDPSMTVRADISGRYSNRLYAYEPNDAKLCKQHTKSFTQICPLPAVLAFMKNRLITRKCSPPLPQCWAIWRRLRSSWSLSCEWEDETLVIVTNMLSPQFTHGKPSPGNFLFFTFSWNVFSLDCLPDYYLCYYYYCTSRMPFE